MRRLVECEFKFILPLLDRISLSKEFYRQSPKGQQLENHKKIAFELDRFGRDSADAFMSSQTFDSLSIQHVIPSQG
jgi:hypothetical protein